MDSQNVNGTSNSQNGTFVVGNVCIRLSLVLIKAGNGNRQLKIISVTPTLRSSRIHFHSERIYGISLTLNVLNPVSAKPNRVFFRFTYVCTVRYSVTQLFAVSPLLFIVGCLSMETFQEIL